MCPTCYDATLDLLYSNVKDAYISLQFPSLGKSDYNLVHLVLRDKPIVLYCSYYDDALEQLRDCTDWDVFVDRSWINSGSLLVITLHFVLK